MSQSLKSSQQRCSEQSPRWQNTPVTTYDCLICLTVNTPQLLQLPCGHNLCLSCLHMICAHSTLACPFCRRRLSNWLRHNPDYSKLIIQREAESIIEEKIVVKQRRPYYRSSKTKSTFNHQDSVHNDWLFARKIYREQIVEHRRTQRAITRSMAKKMKTRSK